MASYTAPRRAGYHLSVCRILSYDEHHHPQSLQYVKPTDSFVFKAIGVLRIRSSDPNSHRGFYNLPPLFQTSISITCERFFGDNQGFLRRHITNQPYFPPEILDHITQDIIPKVQQFFPFGTGFSITSDSEPQEFRLALYLVVDEVNDGEFEHTVMEESMQQHVRMIPVSREAIQSLQTYKLPDQCHICREKFHGEGHDDDDVLFMPMPCGHGFHHGCILQWLQTSHMCPMCTLCPSPTTNQQC